MNIDIELTVKQRVQHLLFGGENTTRLQVPFIATYRSAALKIFVFNIVDNGSRGPQMDMLISSLRTQVGVGVGQGTAVIMAI